MYNCYNLWKIKNKLKYRDDFFLLWYVTDLSNISLKIVKQELLSFPEHLSSPLVFSGVRVTWSLVLCVCFVDRCLSFWSLCCCLFFFDIRILITPFVSSNSSPDGYRTRSEQVKNDLFERGCRWFFIDYQLHVLYILTRIIPGNTKRIIRSCKLEDRQKGQEDKHWCTIIYIEN